MRTTGRWWAGRAALPLRLAVLAAALALAAALGLGVRAAQAQPGTCSTLVNNLNRTLTGLCRGINSGLACYGLDDITASFRPNVNARFSAPGNRAQIAAFRTMRTDTDGAALMVSGAGSGRVKIIVFGGGTSTPGANTQGNVFTLTTNNNVPVCERTPSGMLLQTSGAPGRITVNGVRIDLASTAYVVVGGETLFDQDPSIDRRDGSANPDAPLCSGFDSDCNFGQGSSRCEQGERLVYGPYCDEERYEQIQPGLYTVTLYGRGQVTAGATDYEASGRERFSLAEESMTLPGSFSFCWDGLESGGSGFETIVQAESSNARVTHITLQYMGRDCDRSDPESMGSNPNDIGMMTVYNVEGDVEISGDMGSADVPPETRMRVYYEGSDPVDMDPGPSDATYVMGSDAVEYLAFGGSNGRGGLPEIVVEGGTTLPTTSEPVIDLTVETVPASGGGELLHVEAAAYDPDAGAANGDGVTSVTFRIYDPDNNPIYEQTELNTPYCAFGDNGSECTLFDPSQAGLGAGDYRVEATVLTDAGTETTTETSVTYTPGTEPPTTGSDPVIALVDVSAPDAANNQLLRVQAVAYDAAVGDNDGDGVDTVTFRVYDPFENLVLEHDEQTPPFCMLGEGGGGECAVFDPGDYDGLWPNGYDVVEGDYFVEATLLTDAGTEATADSSIYLAPFTEPTTTSDPVIELVDVSSPSPESNDLLRVQAVAYDAAVGDSNGDGVASVTFRVYDPNGSLVLEHEEGSTPYCMLGESGSDCATFNPDDYGGLWPNGYDVVEGDYYVEATVLTDAGTEASAASSITIALPGGGGGGGASVDTTPPSIGGAVTTPEADYCYGDTIAVDAYVLDDGGVAGVWLYYRFWTDDAAIPDYTWQPMGESIDAFGMPVFATAVTAPSEAYFDYYIYAQDASGNVSESSAAQITGSSCQPVVR